MTGLGAVPSIITEGLLVVHDDRDAHVGELLFENSSSLVPVVIVHVNGPNAGVIDGSVNTAVFGKSSGYRLPDGRFSHQT